MTEKPTEPLRSHHVIGVMERIRRETGTVVAYVLECCICGTRKYFSKHVNLNPPLKLYCQTCKTRTIFEIVPQEKWDLGAGFEIKPRTDSLEQGSNGKGA